jgi:hypothetical protein
MVTITMNTKAPLAPWIPWRNCTAPTSYFEGWGIPLPATNSTNDSPRGPTHQLPRNPGYHCWLRIHRDLLSLLGMAQLYPGYDCEPVTIVASRIPDTIVAFGQTRHNIEFRKALSWVPCFSCCLYIWFDLIRFISSL